MEIFWKIGLERGFVAKRQGRCTPPKREQRTTGKVSCGTIRRQRCARAAPRLSPKADYGWKSRSKRFPENGAATFRSRPSLRHRHHLAQPVVLPLLCRHRRRALAPFPLRRCGQRLRHSGRPAPRGVVHREASRLLEPHRHLHRRLPRRGGARLGPGGERRYGHRGHVPRDLRLQIAPLPLQCHHAEGVRHGHRGRYLCRVHPSPRRPDSPVRRIGVHGPRRRPGSLPPRPRPGDKGGPGRPLGTRSPADHPARSAGRGPHRAGLRGPPRLGQRRALGTRAHGGEPTSPPWPCCG